MYTLEQCMDLERGPDDRAVLLLASQGFMANNPLAPSIVVSFDTLDFFRLLRLRKPSFSVEAFAKVLCDLYSVSI